MTTPNPYAWMSTFTVRQWREQEAAKNAVKRPQLALVTATSTPPKTRKPKMQKTPSMEAKRDKTQTTIKAAITKAAPMLPPVVHRKYAALKPIDHVSIAHGALEAVRSLVIPAHVTGISP